jgi:hypothetical protein
LEPRQRKANVPATVTAHAAFVLTENEERLVVEQVFAGLPEIAHGGYLAGLLATALGGAAAEVRLRRPAATGRRLGLAQVDPELVELRDGDALVAEATPAELALDMPLPVSLAEADAASRRYPGHERHLFPDCFGCGPERHAHDGLRIFPGPVTGRRLVAAPWVPDAEHADGDGRVPAELVWAALDCPQLWSLIVHAPTATPCRVVTEVLATRLEHPVTAGEPHVVMAWPLGQDGRRWVAGAAVLGPGGELCATGRQTAVSTSWGVPLGLAHWRTEQQASDDRRKR